jgi:squalene-hopene/tetraprenyl-beta-curcumene cyclase
MFSIRRISPVLVVLLALAAVSCRPEAEVAAERRAVLVPRIDASLAKAGKYLIAKQSPDGAWRSETYGCFRDGPELTGYVMSTLFFMPQSGEEAKVSYRKGADYLAGWMDEKGRIKADPPWLNFPVYSAASSSRVVVLQERSERNLRAQKAWLEYVLARQLTEQLGWQPADPQYGGWGFSIQPPKKPAAGGQPGSFFESNLSATVFGVAALRSAKLPPEHPAYRAALSFALKCQNFSEDPAKADPRFDDGGFFFIPGDAGQNKAGVAGQDRFGRERFHSYGTMTADGLRVLVRCGLPLDHPRVVAARQWLERNFSAERNPGNFAKDREVLRNATYYYWAWAAAHAFQAVNVREFRQGRRRVCWAEELAVAMLKRQEPDGSWINRGFTDAKEDDPLVAAPWAAATLAICRNELVGGIEKGDRGPMLTDRPGR